jgi:hypothetical protein
MTEEHNIKVSESKFNGTSTLEVYGAPERKHAKWFAKKFWREEYGHDPSKIVAEENELYFGQKVWTVMVADHSSGSLKGSRTYEFELEE